MIVLGFLLGTILAAHELMKGEVKETKPINPKLLLKSLLRMLFVIPFLVVCFVALW
ncbi:MAG: hypothetical protein OXC64_05420 [Flavobacteriaceae bacterium]|nr:hypothetical protein [Flavobacteriaceae bacterium]